VKARIKADIRQFIVNTWLSGDERGFDDDTDLYQTGILDSFSMLALVGFLGDSFHVRLEPPDMTPQTFQCVESVARVVMEKLERGNAS
jgi:acyl carrier protein